MAAVAVPRVTVEEYLAAELVAEVPSEYVDGVVTPIEAATGKHAILMNNVAACFAPKLRDTECVGMIAPHVAVTTAKYLVPDFAAVCGKITYSDPYDVLVTNPKVIIEIVSPSTEGRDTGLKARLYKKIPTLMEYVLVAQGEPFVEILRRRDRFWVSESLETLDSILALESLGVEIPLSELYAKVLP